MDGDTYREPRCSSAELIDRTHGSPARACPARPARSALRDSGRFEKARNRTWFLAFFYALASQSRFLIMVAQVTIDKTVLTL